ncbi:hypothetical protein K7X08_017264 [Anisodus acutangulus]|uniref:Uncharacterized protein n=1 Tax=Anisodus acutangulus TaxID=402998 RepID=A0A9Q1R9F1_9SOLA|nr:hypothetical protein K7X08_017264 [Anisodus acutangulus]
MKYFFTSIEKENVSTTEIDEIVKDGCVEVEIVGGSIPEIVVDVISSDHSDLQIDRSSNSNIEEEQTKEDDAENIQEKHLLGTEMENSNEDSEESSEMKK